MTPSPMRQAVALLVGLTLRHRGKVRDTYDLGNGRLLIVATNAISIFDIVLNALIPEKGAVLTAMSHFWFKKLEGELEIKTHLVAAGAGIDQYLPANLRNNRDLQSRAMVVRRLTMTPIEFVYRNCMTGSGYEEYLRTGKIAGVDLIKGLQNGDRLPCIIFDPTTKEESGHDKRIDPNIVLERYPEEVALGHRMFWFAMNYAQSRGILLADSKLEIAGDTVGDEAFTPDSSRFWDLEEWFKGREAKDRKPPSPRDKQLIRDYGVMHGIDKLDPLIDEDLERAHGLVIPEELIMNTARVYRDTFGQLTDMRLEEYQLTVMGIEE
ncbi:MAG: phosphoribosylaminoimidazolesuccinocarboxamide synthase [Minisyncoccia bacterium]